MPARRWLPEFLMGITSTWRQPGSQLMRGPSRFFYGFAFEPAMALAQFIGASLAR